MKSQQTLFVCEFITGGGFSGAALPESLAQEGLMMRDALLKDLAALDDWRIVTTHDARVSPPSVYSITVDAISDVWAIWRECMAAADAVWVIAPETDHILYHMAEMARELQVCWIGPQLEAIAVTSQKYLTAQVLARAGLPVIPTYFYSEWLPDASRAWVVKPNDGAGCESTYMFNQADALNAWFVEDPQRQHTHVIQPYVTGTPASICVLGYSDEAFLLGCNLQSIVVQDGKFSYVGGCMNGAAAYWPQLNQLAQAIKAATPGLVGYFGVDVLLDTPDAGGLTIVEINPRLTTSYAYLNQAMGCNPAAMIIEAMLAPAFTAPAIQREQIAFYV